MSAYEPPNQNFGSVAPPKKSGMKTVLIILGVVGVLGLLCCGGFAGLGYFGFNAATQVMTSAATQRIEGSTEGSAAIGTVESAKMNLVATGEAAKEYEGQSNVIVIDVKGSEGSGQFIGQFKQQGGGWNWAKLKMDNGDEIDLDEPTLEVETPDFSPVPATDEEPAEASSGTTS